MAPGLIVAAPASGSGKTLLTLGLLRLLARRGLKVASAKVGPDYIDPAFHHAATGRPCPNLDPWAMRPGTLAGIVSGLEGDVVVAEGVMGLFDGADAPAGEPAGSTADLAAATGWPVVLVADCRAMAASAAALVAGFARFRPDVAVTGVVLNRVGSERHARMASQAIAAALPDVAVLGALPKLEDLVVPSRHLGLVQACEHPDLPAFLDAAADAVERHLDVDALLRLARPCRLAAAEPALPLPPLGARIAVARDEAFAFAYPTLLEGWRRAGAELSFFSPLADQAPEGDAVYLPGGYPELHAARLAGNRTFLDGLRAAAARGAFLWGECGGYMVLGRTLTDAQGNVHAMAGLLGLDTSFARRRRQLGYRRARLLAETPLGPVGQTFRGHEFHFATVTAEDGPPLFACADAAYAALPPSGLVEGRVAGSFVHLIDRG